MAIALYRRPIRVMMKCKCFVQQAYGSDDVMAIALYTRLMRGM